MLGVLLFPGVFARGRVAIPRHGLVWFSSQRTESVRRRVHCDP